MPYNFKQLKQVLAEKLIRDPRITYLENPTKQELIAFIKKSKEKEVRFILDKNENMYVWDAFYEHHETFSAKILEDQYPYRTSKSLGYIIKPVEGSFFTINLISSNDKNFAIDYFVEKYGARKHRSTHRSDLYVIDL